MHDNADYDKSLASAWGDGYLQGWRAAMTEARGGDWSASYPVEWWPKEAVQDCAVDD